MALLRPSYVQLREDDVSRLKSVFLKTAILPSEQEAWEGANAPQAFLLLERRVLFLPTWELNNEVGRKKLELSFYSYERRGYERALDNLMLNPKGKIPVGLSIY